MDCSARSAELAVKDIRKQVRTLANSLGAPAFLWKIFEMSGTRAGQETAFAQLGYGASLAIVGYTTDRVEIPLSNLMAFEATARGNWGADPLIYPELVQWIGAGRLTVKAFRGAVPAARHQYGLRRGAPRTAAEARRPRSRLVCR